MIMNNTLIGRLYKLQKELLCTLDINVKMVYLDDDIAGSKKYVVRRFSKFKNS